MLLESFSMGETIPKYIAALRQTLRPLGSLCVRCFQPSHSPRFCTLLVCCLASLCISLAVAVLFSLRTSVLLCPRISLPAPFLRRMCRHRGLQDLCCGLALSPVRHDLPPKKTKGAGTHSWGRLTWQVEGVLTCFACLMS